VAAPAAEDGLVSQARESILGRVRGSLGRGAALDEGIAQGLRERMGAPPVHVQPRFQSELGERFITKLEAVGGTVERVRALEHLPAAVLGHLERHGLPKKAVVSGDAVVAEASWPEDLITEQRAANGTDQVSLTGAFAAVAETGTLVLLSGALAPTTLNFLPELHLVVLRRSQICPHLEDAWTAIRRHCDRMPRTVNLITGPSRTADVEQTIQLGAHGPRRLHVFLLDD
jgi:L-lactate dehydrogenase complex protein LldG